MTSSSSFLVKWLAVGAFAASCSTNCIAKGATFVDDRGLEFTWDNAKKAKVVTRAATGGLSLFHMGMTDDQLVATWGLWAIRGSDYDPDDPFTPGTFAEDPGKEAAAFLDSAINLSECRSNPRGCFRFDNGTDVLNLYEAGDIDFVLNIDNGNSDEVFMPLEDVGVPVIFVDTFYDYNPNCRMANYSTTREFCYGRSMIDIASRIEELAVFLGVDTNTEELTAQKQKACEDAEAFTNAMADVQERGIRVKASILGSGKDEETGESFVNVRDFDPIKLWVPRTLEELGMPLLHAGNYTPGGVVDNARVPANDYFSNCDAGVVNETCNGDTLFPVDFWLIDSRSFRNIDDNFKLAFPDRAFLADQYWHYPRNDGGLSYLSISILLTDLTRELSKAKKVQDTNGPECISIDPKDIAHRVTDGTGGLGLNGFVCYNKDLIEEEYLKCPPAFVSPVAPPTNAPLVVTPTIAPTVPPTGAPVNAPPAPQGAEPSAAGGEQSSDDSSAKGVSSLWLSIASMLAIVFYHF